MQVLAVVAPTVLEYLPAPQLMQVLLVEAPTVEVYLPAPQFVQAGAPAAEDVPAPQLMQVLAVVAPTVGEYWPAPQLMQVLAVVAPTVGEYVPAPQLVQIEAPAPEYVPAAQSSTHAAEPLTVLYFPATHTWHPLLAKGAPCPGPPPADQVPA